MSTYYHPEYGISQSLPGEAERPVTRPSYYVMVAEVEVDPETGKMRGVSLTYGADCGQEINPMRVEGQIEGSIQMGVGMVLGEAVTLDKGQMLNASLLHYRFPTAMEMPELQGIHLYTEETLGPFGAKEAGEGATCSVPSALVNALYDATGVWFKEMPVTPEKILRALGQKRQAGRKR